MCIVCKNTTLFITAIKANTSEKHYVLVTPASTTLGQSPYFTKKSDVFGRPPPWLPLHTHHCT